MLTRNYREDETPKIGDTVQLFEGAYGAAVVTKLDPDGHANICERVHASVSFRSISIGVERVAISDNRLHSCPVFVNGPKGQIDNRDYTPNYTP